MKIDINSLNYNDLKQKIKELKMANFRADQIFTWLHKKGVKTFYEMSDISIKDRHILDGIFYVGNVVIDKKYQSKLDKTIKYLLKLRDGEVIEAVVMDYGGQKSICISTQVGCKMGCEFCASKEAGFVRNLKVSELLGQVYEISKDLKAQISNVTLMGIGEPLYNFENVLKFIDIITDKRGRDLGKRKITLSTCGVCDIIDKMACLNLGVTLAISLHAPNDKVRDRLMPINKKYGIEKLLKSCDNYARRTKRRISFEYICLEGVNDSLKDADRLSKLLKPILCHVNLLWYNSVKGIQFKTSKRSIESFENKLIEDGICVTVRRRLGRDLDAACGQLRRKRIKNYVKNGV